MRAHSHDSQPTQAGPLCGREISLMLGCGNARFTFLCRVRCRRKIGHREACSGLAEHEVRHG